MLMKFHNRIQAGKMLGESLIDYANHENLLVLALPRGGVPVGWEIAKALNAPLDVCIVRKIGVPGQKELAMGAIGAGGVRVFNRDVIATLGIDRDVIETVVSQELEELKRREQIYRGSAPPIKVENKTVILVDDGIATGATIRAAIAVLKQQKPSKIVVAIPVASASTYRELESEVDEVVCLQTPEFFSAIGFWYEDFSQTSDQEVCEILGHYI
ncbi:phosphoribosyltransferase [Cylindrospermopsis raciborskii]|uniref:Phosphoribosyl transferase n=1 Tax=Cylindrospermopsis raciborskii CENA302 TaxID=1170768 RepID=A0A9Q5QUL0_9CYAN|nr:phosphoribosyltransferase [Cylindrospermopsis raciborskii]MCZ2201845.1 phosphoribosyltransferase [Cylindrospermopsis raciborskii PAMP2012]MCZ2206842.1 phosphoribosyltransferase [Cylindrospermopsis raciborskii PAMP2011]NLQ06162.1 phosphoribosyltransferase [Cylindrospermopsis raciborskii MVCC19]OHY32464.1 phosphoribosyl transferase [Cylindrospermopsis raciborskii MVCC14]OPH08619.1 phosphoribosyl transferase [Cylindrospermopsis raciborskii CENA302]